MLRMKSRRFPLWLLRDMSCLIAVMASFWPLMIFAIVHGGRAMSGIRPTQQTCDRLAQLLAKAKSTLNHALWRQAYRLCGWDPRAVVYADIAAPTCWAETSPRYLSYFDAFQDMEALARAYADQLRARHNLPASCHPARRRFPPSPTGGGGGARVFARDGGGMPHRVPAHARGPPQHA